VGIIIAFLGLYNIPRNFETTIPSGKNKHQEPRRVQKTNKRLPLTTSPLSFFLFLHLPRLLCFDFFGCGDLISGATDAGGFIHQLAATPDLIKHEFGHGGRRSGERDSGLDASK
jgi:hypothetical protein